MIGANQIGVLFLPVMLGYGLAYVLVLFSRRDSAANLTARLIFYVALFVVSALPLGFTLLPSNVPPFQFPPYFEPGINRLGSWTTPREIVASDMPWAVAWYADRKSLWIPNKLKDLTGLADNAKLPGDLAGVFLTPISRNTPLFTSVIKGEYAEYQPLIFGRTDVPYFPVQGGDPRHRRSDDLPVLQRHQAMGPGQGRPVSLPRPGGGQALVFSAEPGQNRPFSA